MKPSINPWISISDLLSSVILVILLLLVVTAIIPKMTTEYKLSNSMDKLSEKLSPYSGKGMVVVNTDEYKVELTDVTFETASACIDSSYDDVISILAENFNEMLLIHPKMSILIEGHTDPRPVTGVVNRCGYFQNNFELSTVRAINVRESLLQKFVNSDSLQARVGVGGYGDTRLKNTSDSTSAKNRRIDIRLLN
mgnify:CR=1 FL=1